MDDVRNIKIILLGEMGTGKTNLINAYFGKPFDSNTFTTLAPEFYQKKLTIKDINCTVGVWDTAGQEKYRSISKIVINGAQIVIYVYDITKKGSFEELEYWCHSVEEVLGKKVILGLAANKIDLYENQVVSKQEGEKYAKDIGALFKETSAKDDPNGFCNFINQLLEKYIDNNNNEDIIEDNTKKRMSINKHKKKKKKKFFC